MFSNQQLLQNWGPRWDASGSRVGLGCSGLGGDLVCLLPMPADVGGSGGWVGLAVLWGLSAGVGGLVLQGGLSRQKLKLPRILGI